MEASQLLVKNTFIHGWEEEAPATAERRSSSEPPSFSPIPLRQGSESVSKTSRKISRSSWADASTEASQSGDEGLYAESESASSQDQSPAAASPSKIDEMPIVCRGGGRTPLTTRAKAWFSIIPSASPELLGLFAHQIVTIVGAVTAAVEASKMSRVTSASNGPLGWSIVIQIPRKEVSQRRERVLSLVKATLLKSCEVSDNIYVLGYLAKPFVPTQKGFAAMLGVVSDDNSACWDMVTLGHCSRGCSCKWQHPACNTTLDISIEAG